MIDSKFIMQYTNALYSTDTMNSPRYDEFRDMFSTGQIMSKEWILTHLLANASDYRNTSFAIAGAWFGTLGALLLSEFEDAKVTFLDIDPRCEKYLHNIFWNDPRAKLVTADMYAYKYTEDVIINTSCEHIPDLKAWLDLLPSRTKVILQSNNYDSLPEHINCVRSQTEFVAQAGLSEVHMVGEMKMNMFTRYMIIGRT